MACCCCFKYFQLENMKIKNDFQLKITISSIMCMDAYRSVAAGLCQQNGAMHPQLLGNLVLDSTW
jgi:hypothetical protein